jgi:biotin carboxylase
MIVEKGIVLFMGMVRRGEYENLQKRNIPLGILVDTNSRHRLGDVSEFVFFELFDFSRPLPELIAKVHAIHTQRPIACLFNVGEYYVSQTANVAEALDIAYVSPESARLCVDKNLMRKRFQERIGPNTAAHFYPVTSESELTRFAELLGYPVFLQPANVAASMWATCNSGPDVLLQNYRTMLREVPAYLAKLGKKDTSFTVIIAEYMQGSNTSIDCLADRTGRVYTTPVVDVLTGRDIGFDDFHHFARIIPSRLNIAEQEALMRLAISGVQALDMTSVAAHVEFIGLRLGEIGARPGGNRPRILDMACGIDFLHAYYRVLCGQTPDLRAVRNLAAGIVTPFANCAGTLHKIRHLDELVTLPGYLYNEIRIQPGQPVGPAQSGYRAPLYIELLSDNADIIRRSVDRIAAWTDLYEVE